MRLHENKTLFTQLLNFSANTLNIRPEFIEKIIGLLVHYNEWHKIQMSKKSFSKAELRSQKPTI